MEIENIRHKALRTFAETGSAKDLPAALVASLRGMLAYLAAIGTVDELRTPPNYGAHQLIGDRGGGWSLTVTKNWRITFRVRDDVIIEDMDLEDYH